MNIIDSATSYSLAVVVLAGSAIITNASAIMTVGGLVLLGLRLYVDGKRALKAWSETK